MIMYDEMVNTLSTGTNDISCVKTFEDKYLWMNAGRTDITLFLIFGVIKKGNVIVVMPVI
jgi:hypothetical protein